MQQKLQPAEETPEVVADGGANGIGGIALAVPEIVSTHPMFGFEMADDPLNGRAATSPFICVAKDRKMAIVRYIANGSVEPLPCHVSSSE